MKKSIKSIVAAIVGLVMSVAFVSCGNPTIQDLADKMNKELPKDMGNGMVLKKAEVNDNYIEFQAEGDESVKEVSLILVDGIGDLVSKQFKEMMLQSEDMKEIYDLCKKENKGMKMIMKGNKSGKSVTLFNITPEEMQKQ